MILEYMLSSESYPTPSGVAGSFALLTEVFATVMHEFMASYLLTLTTECQSALPRLTLKILYLTCL